MNLHSPFPTRKTVKAYGGCLLAGWVCQVLSRICLAIEAALRIENSSKKLFSKVAGEAEGMTIAVG